MYKYKQKEIKETNKKCDEQKILLKDLNANFSFLISFGNPMRALGPQIGVEFSRLLDDLTTPLVPTIQPSKNQPKNLFCKIGSEKHD